MLLVEGGRGVIRREEGEKGEGYRRDTQGEGEEGRGRERRSG